MSDFKKYVETIQSVDEEYYSEIGIGGAGSGSYYGMMKHMKSILNSVGTKQYIEALFALAIRALLEKTYKLDRHENASPEQIVRVVAQVGKMFKAVADKEVGGGPERAYMYTDILEVVFDGIQFGKAEAAKGKTKEKKETREAEKEIRKEAKEVKKTKFSD